jgi:hypothetical protein
MTNFADGQTLTAKQLNDAFAAAGTGGGGTTVQADWTASSGTAQILNKPTLAAVATSGAKADVGLGNVDNTADANKPVSTAQATAIATAALPSRKLIASKGTPTSNVTGTSTSTTYPLAVIAIPANSLSLLNGFLEVKFRINANVSSSVKTISASLNTQDLGVTLQLANLAAGDVTIIIQNKNATNAQQVTNSTAPNAAATQTTVDMTAAQNLTILGTLSTAGDTLNVGRYTVEVSNA